MSNIPAGYQLHVESWENDGDNYKTQIMNGLTLADVNFLLDVGKPFTRRGRWGNDCVDTGLLHDYIQTILGNHPNISTSIRAEWDISEDNIMSPVHELLGSASEGYDYEFCRVFDSFEVFFFPTEVADVTSQFK